MADEVERCDHEVCTCAKAEDSDYCSPYCESAGESDTTAIACECGHTGCGGASM
jgi:hypothetical protein